MDSIVEDRTVSCSQGDQQREEGRKEMHRDSTRGMVFGNMRYRGLGPGYASQVRFILLLHACGKSTLKVDVLAAQYMSIQFPSEMTAEVLNSPVSI